MKNVKFSLKTVICLLLVVAMAFSMVACKKHKKHDYSAKVTEPTCTAEGYTTYKCDCGESYVGDKVPALGHKYEEKVTRYPTSLSAGIVTKTCSVCGASMEEELATLTVTLPSVAEFLHNLVGSNSINLNTEDLDLILIREISGAYQKQYLALELAHLEIDGQCDDLSAYISLRFGVASYDAEGADPYFENKVVFNLVVNGDEVSVALTVDDELKNADFNMTDEFYGAMLDAMGMDYDQFVELISIGIQVVDYLPVIDNVLDSIGTLESVGGNVDMSGISSVLGDDFVTENDGKVTINTAKVTEFIESLQGKSVASLINSEFGAGTMDELTDYLASLPTTKVRDVAEMAITLSEKCGVPINNVYALINLLIYEASGVEFDVEKEITDRYDLTVVQIISEYYYGSNATDEEINDLIAQLETEIRSSIGIFGSYTVDQLYNFLVFSNPDHTVDGEIFSITESLLLGMESVKELVSFDVETDEDGNLTGIYYELEETSFEYSKDENGYLVKLASGASAILLSITEEEILFAVYDYEQSEEALAEISLTYVNNYEEKYYIFSFADVINVVYTTLFDEFKSLDIECRGYADETESCYNTYTGEYEFTTNRKTYKVADISFSKNNDTYSYEFIGSDLVWFTVEYEENGCEYRKSTCEVDEKAMEQYGSFEITDNGFVLDAELYLDGEFAQSFSVSFSQYYDSVKFAAVLKVDDEVLELAFMYTNYDDPSLEVTFSGEDEDETVFLFEIGICAEGENKLNVDAKIENYEDRLDLDAEVFLYDDSASLFAEVTVDDVVMNISALADEDSLEFRFEGIEGGELLYTIDAEATLEGDTINLEVVVWENGENVFELEGEFTVYDDYILGNVVADENVIVLRGELGENSVSLEGSVNGDNAGISCTIGGDKNEIAYYVYDGTELVEQGSIALNLN